MSVRLVTDNTPIPPDIATAFCGLWDDLRAAELTANFEAIVIARQALDALRVLAGKRGPQPPRGV